MSAFGFTPIGRIRSCFPEKFGIPRQPGLVPEARGLLEIVPPFNQREAFRGLEDFSHVWVLFVFHQCYRHKWKATIRPPRLGGNRRVGVFASRTGFRPNAIGQSVVSLLAIEGHDNCLRLHLGGIDLLDGTPILDIKPYLPYADGIAHAKAGYAPASPVCRFPVHFSPRAGMMCKTLDPHRYPDLKNLITIILAQDPRPAYQQPDQRPSYGLRLWDLNVRFTVGNSVIVVDAIEPIPEHLPPDNGNQEHH